MKFSKESPPIKCKRLTEASLIQIEFDQQFMVRILVSDSTQSHTTHATDHIQSDQQPENSERCTVKKKKSASGVLWNVTWPKDNTPKDLCKQLETNTERPSSWKPVPPPPLLCSPNPLDGEEVSSSTLFHLKVPITFALCPQSHFANNGLRRVCLDTFFYFAHMQSKSEIPPNK